MREFSFRKTDRLRKSIDYRKLNLSGRKVENHEFILIYKKNVLKNSRLGITVSKKVGIAVERNRIKRITREFFRTNRYLFIEGGVDLNVIAKRSASSRKNKDLFESLKEVAKKIDIKKRG